MKYQKLLTIIAWFVSTNTLYAQPNSDFEAFSVDSTAETTQALNDERFAGWTEEEYKAYEDSIYCILYPPVEVCRQDVSTINVNPAEEDSSSNSRSVGGTNVPNNVYISTSYAVGEIPIQSGTTQSGARTYTVPINVYPGMHGHQPELSLIYNSQQGNSFMGVGWSISGLSSIERTAKTRYYDDKSEGIRMDTTDAFVLDGIHLVRLSKSSSYILYESEVGNIKVKGYYTGKVMRFFEVFYPNGNWAYYGSFYNQSTNELSYPVYYLYDIHGNMISYQYSRVNYNYRVSSITYNGASVGFSYTDSRPDPIVAYSGGVSKNQDYLLSSITCKFGSDILGTYTLSYTTDRNRSLLTQIDYSSHGESLSPLQFYYGDRNHSSSFASSSMALSSWYSTGNSDNLKMGRVKCDYSTDAEGVFVTRSCNPYWHHYRAPAWNHHSENKLVNVYDLYSDSLKIFVYRNLSEIVSTPDEIPIGTGFIDVLCTDLDGEQEEKVIKVNNVVANDSDQVTFKAYARNPYGGLSCYYNRTYRFNTVYTDARGNKSIQPKYYYTGDFNGDGRMDILAVSAHQPFGDTTKPSKCYLFDLVNDRILFHGHVMPYHVELIGTQQDNADSAYHHTDRLFALDYDGDGKTDLCHINDNGTDIYTFDVHGDSLVARLVGTYQALARNGLLDRVFIPGEFNGDGLTDILVSPARGSNLTTWNIYNSKGNGQFIRSDITGPSYPELDGYGFFAHDINQDGLHDLVYYAPTYFCTYLNSGNALGSINSMNSYPQSHSVLVPTDLNSHNVYAQLVCLRDSFITRYRYSCDDGAELQMTGMVNSSGVIEKNEYRNLREGTGSDTFYGRTGIGTFPYVDINEPINVLAASTTFLDYSAIDTCSYQYEDAILHRQGLGFQGFKTIRRIDSRQRLSIQVYDPLNHGVLKRVETPQLTQTYNYSITLGTNRLLKVRLTEKTENDLLKGNTVTTTYSYDSFGNPTQELATYSDGATIKTVNTISNNTSVGSGYYIGFLRGQTVTKTKGSSNVIERFYIPLYQKLQPTAKNHYVNGNRTRSETFTYDSNGNATSVSEKRYTSDNSLQTTYAYDSYGRRIQQTDPLGLTTAYTYNGSGLLETETDYRGNTTTHAYDAFGRDTLTVYADSTHERTTYGWNRYHDSFYCINKAQTGKPSTSVSYDALGREVVSSQTGLYGGERQVSKEYDTYGRLFRVSIPYIGSTPAGWNTYTYDDNDRVTSYTEATGKVTATSYSGNSVTTTENGRTTTRTYDPRGNLISVTDPGGTITYNLASDGQPNSIVAPGGTTTFAYDVYRRRFYMKDPSAGYTRYTFDTAGNISSESNSQGQIRNYTYDSYNRLIGVSTTEFNSTYIYNNYNELVSVTSDNATFRTYTYDNYGRLVSCRETAPYDVWFQKDFSYREGNIDTVRYTSYTGLSVFEKRSYTNGYLSESKLNGTTAIYRLISENAFGQPTTIFTGGLQRNYTFTSLGVPTGRSTQFGSNAVFDESYNFDNDMNLLSRTDNKRNLTEQFTYDNLGRLTSYGGNTVTYANNGNMTGRSDVGTMFYTNTAKPYAISGITPVNNAVPMRNQTITYTSFGRPKLIAENGNSAQFVYNDELKRVRMDAFDGGNHTTHYYLGGCYEHVYGNNIPSTEHIYLMGDYYDACAVYVKTGTTEETRYIIRDYLGSIRAVSNYFGSSYNEYSYDAWGRMRNPANWHVYAPDSVPVLELGRGYTGHEHLSQFGLINMNARLYDPAVGRFLSPDPYVQMPDFTQNFNRYSYALNNPLKYVDESGELFIIDDWIWGAFKGLIKGRNIWKSANQQAKNAAKIWGGLFTLDSNKNFFQKTWELLSRFTWQCFQTWIGFGVAHFVNSFSTESQVSYKY